MTIYHVDNVRRVTSRIKHIAEVHVNVRRRTSHDQDKAIIRVMHYKSDGLLEFLAGPIQLLLHCQVLLGGCDESGCDESIQCGGDESIRSHLIDFIASSARAASERVTSFQTAC